MIVLCSGCGRGTEACNCPEVDCDHCDDTGYVFEPCPIHAYQDYCPPGCEHRGEIPCMNCARGERIRQASKITTKEND